MHKICHICLVFVFMTKQITFMMFVQTVLEFCMLQYAKFKVFLDGLYVLFFPKTYTTPY